jgi:cell division protein FtsN
MTNGDRDRYSEGHNLGVIPGSMPGGFAGSAGRVSQPAYMQDPYGDGGAGEEYDEEFDDFEEGEGRGRLLIFAVLGILILGGLGALAYYAYERGAASTATAPVVIRADESPVKVAPEDPGGLEVPHQDKLVYDRLEGQLPADDGAGPPERLMPSPEQPMDMEALRGGLKETAPAANVAAVSAPASPPQAAPVPIPAPAQPAAPLVPSASQAAPSNSPFVIQLAALRSEAEAKTLFARLSQGHSDILAGLSADIERAELGPKGVFYRLRLVPLADRAAADSLCAKLKARGQECIVKAR